MPGKLLSVLSVLPAAGTTITAPLETSDPEGTAFLWDGGFPGGAQHMGVTAFGFAVQLNKNKSMKKRQVSWRGRHGGAPEAAGGARGEAPLLSAQPRNSH